MTTENDNIGSVQPFSEAAWQRSTSAMNSKPQDPAVTAEMTAALNAQRQSNPPVRVDVNHIGANSMQREGTIFANATDKSGMPTETLTEDTILHFTDASGRNFTMPISVARQYDLVGRDEKGYFEIDQANINSVKQQLGLAEKQAALADKVMLDPELEQTHSHLLNSLKSSGIDSNSLVVGWLHNDERLPSHIVQWAESNAINPASVEAHCHEFLNKLVVAGLARSVAAKGIDVPHFSRWCNENGIVTSNQRVSAVLEMYHNGTTSRLDQLVMKYKEAAGKLPGKPAGTYDPFAGQRRIA